VEIGPGSGYSIKNKTMSVIKALQPKKFYALDINKKYAE